MANRGRDSPPQTSLVAYPSRVGWIRYQILLFQCKRFYPIETLAEWQSRRYFVERSLQDAKGLAGLDEYQVTGWMGWHHHTAMVLLAMLFLLRLKRRLAPKSPMLTLKDSLEILKIVMPKKKLSFEEAAELIYKKHLNRSRNCRLQKKQIWLKDNGFLA